MPHQFRLLTQKIAQDVGSAVSCRARQDTPENTPKCKSLSWDLGGRAGTGIGPAIRSKAQKAGNKKPPWVSLGRFGIVGVGCGDRI